MKIAILTSPNQWFIPYAKKLANELKCPIFYHHDDIEVATEILFILSYHKIIPNKMLKIAKHNIIIHASALPFYKGFAPLFWQVIEGANEITFSLFEANQQCDAGDIYMQKTLYLSGTELYEELREKQASHTIEMCLEFLNIYPNINAKKQESGGSIYPKRSPKDSELDINKSIKEQFNLLRTVSNSDFPAFFNYLGKKYTLKIYCEGGGGAKYPNSGLAAQTQIKAHLWAA